MLWPARTANLAFSRASLASRVNLASSRRLSRMASTLPRLPLFEALAAHDAHSTAVVHSLSGRSFTYGELVHDVAAAKDDLHRHTRGHSTAGARISFLVENGYDYVVTLLAILAAHAVAVPLSPAFPVHELRYIVDQSDSLLLLSSPKFHNQAADVLKEGIHTPPIHYCQPKITDRAPRAASDHGSDNESDTAMPSVPSVTLAPPASTGGGMMLYTSGTTSRPKGVLLPQDVLTAQARSLLTAWDYSPRDLLLHVLPLHHIHGTVNALLTPLFAGSTIEFLFPFNAAAVWNRLAAPFRSDPAPTQRPITFLTVVPTIYTRLLASHPDLSPDLQAASKLALRPENLRLNISGSAALPTPVKAAWTELSGGNVLLERYGMTEVGMALSCGLPFSSRVDGSVGWPLPSVSARLVDTETQAVIPLGGEIDPETGKERQGEIQLRGPTIFREYWKNPEATAKEFVADEDGQGKWFRTGDVAVRRQVPDAVPDQASSPSWTQGPMYTILGRLSTDIFKTGGEKVSALEIERELLSLPQVAEVAVVGLPSEAWGQKVAAVVVLSEAGKAAGKGGKPWSVLDMRRALKEKLATYKIPQEMKVVPGLERNAMGKVNKKVLVETMWGASG